MICINMIACIIQARTGSSRLPGKVMFKINQTDTLLSFVLRQVQSSKFIKKTIVATTNLPEDDLIESFLDEHEVLCFRGDPFNVLDRYYQCAKKFDIKTIIRITSDCPLVDPNIIDSIIQKFVKGNYDYATNCFPRMFPHGLDVEVFSFEVLEKIWNIAKLPSEKEHVTSYIYNHSEKFKIFNLRNDEDYSQLRITVDYEEDFQLIQKILLKIKNRPILLNHIVDLFKKEPELFLLNKKYKVNEGYLKSLKEDERFLN